MSTQYPVGAEILQAQYRCHPHNKCGQVACDRGFQFLPEVAGSTNNCE